jgi:hypothetical protein
MIKKSCIVVVKLILVMVLSIPAMTNAQITSSYHSKDPHVNYTAFTLTVYSPNNQAYQTPNGTMPLNFSIRWTAYPSFSNVWSPMILKTNYSYAIDNYPAVAVTSNQSSNDIFGHNTGRFIVVNPTFAYLVNISSLSDGYHKIEITASMSKESSGGSEFLNATSDPIEFLVQSHNYSIPSPTPTVPEFSWLTILPLLASILLVSVATKRFKH